MNTQLEKLFGKEYHPTYGIDEQGIWAKAWKLWRKFNQHADLCLIELERNEQDQLVPTVIYNDLIEAILTLAVKKPEILEQEPGYLLEGASQRVYVEYRRRARGISPAFSYNEFEGEDSNGLEYLLTDWDQQCHSTAQNQEVRDVYVDLSEVDQLICARLVEGVKKSAIARELGMSNTWITKQVKRLQIEFLPVLA